MFYCKSINTEDANDWDWKNSLNFKSESYVSCKLKDCNLQLTIRNWGSLKGLWFRFNGSLHNNKSWKAIVLTAAYSYNRGLTILTVWLFSYVVNTTDNKWIYFDKKIKINIWNLIPWYCSDKWYDKFSHHWNISIHKGTSFCPKWEK